MATYNLTLCHDSDLSDDDYPYHVWCGHLTYADTNREVFPDREPYDDQQFMTAYDDSHPDITISLTSGQLNGLEPMHLSHLSYEVESALEYALELYRTYAADTGFTF